MTFVRLELARNFMLGDDVVLLAMDGAGVAAIAAAVKDAELHGASELEHPAMTQEFVVQPGDSTILIDSSRALWRLSPQAAREIAECLDALSEADRPGHHYVDISAPSDTLVLSRDEYV